MYPDVFGQVAGFLAYFLRSVNVSLWNNETKHSVAHKLR